MKKNVGKTDSLIRIIISIVILAVLLTGKATGTLAIILGVVGVILLTTALVRICPIWLVFGWSTAGKKN